MTNLFEKNLAKSHEKIRESRIERYAREARLEQEALFAKLTKECDRLKNKLEDLEDLSPDSTLSLQPIKDGNFNGKAWVEAMQEVNVDLENKKFELDIAKKNLKKYFSEEENNSKSQ